MLSYNSWIYQAKMLKAYISILSALLLILLSPLPVSAMEGFGVHILHPDELSLAKDFLQDESNQAEWHYVTIPLTLNELTRVSDWQQFFSQARQEQLIPIIRLATRFENGAWQIPTRKDITDLFTFLNQFEWPTSERYVIAFNEVNHAPEWGGKLDPVGYSATLEFVTYWAHSENKGYVVLPAAMDLAAGNTATTREAFAYLEQMYDTNPEIFDLIDVWNSHSYPNPGFSSAPTYGAKNSVRGFVHELAWLKQKTGRDFETFITETGWVNTPYTSRWLTQYYLYALQHVWSHPQVKGVTPFLLKGDPGPFSQFGFIDQNNQPTAQYNAVKEAFKRLREQS
ncbi:MAG: hypothetical protein UY13_C0002G0429 [Candidatus Pacebacteria bacterium GW2011_GWB1_47_8]|nr:MAG: hypothetical protein UX28_C0001G0576 [Candidatus Pacebacteria bacterium GW2011_GWA1_46_10]KKU84517.1 MAG: hypothetical protein UY13_C0002G0429 [Candidatus Pacebacteria bacterium GW2011_GWB1_47_8]